MKEAAFLQQNRKRWQEFEELLSQQTKADPDQLADLFVQLTDDLAFARTHYAASNTVRYLNGLTAKVHQALYRNRKERGNRFIQFWQYEVPMAVRSAHREIFYAFMIMLASTIIGAVSTYHDPEFARAILGSRYVDETIENIDRGAPMAIYGTSDETASFLAITFNNVLVSLRMFAMGLIVSVGSAIELISNGVMLGVFQYFFIQRGLGVESALVVWIHGTLEISALIIAGGAGIVLGNSILFPRTYSRKDSLLRAARTGMKIVLGLVPVFMAAGFLEGFVTRHTEMPVGGSLGIIGASLLFVIWYFVVYPIVLERKHADATVV